MMDLINRDIATMLQTLFAKRMLGNISVADCTPAPTVDFVVIGRTLIFVVFPSGLGLVFIAVATVGKFRTTGVTAGMWELVRHGQVSFRRESDEKRFSIISFFVLLLFYFEFELI